MTWSNITLREHERDSIEAFVELHLDKLSGRVLDYGCGRQPYRRLVQRAGGDYTPYDRVAFPACVAHTSTGPDNPLGGDFDAILCTQVIQYVHSPLQLLTDFSGALSPGGWLVMTGPTNWPEVESEDLWRFTQRGIMTLLVAAGFYLVNVSTRASLVVNDIKMSLGWGAIARCPSPTERNP